jgi:hypothetical protein
VRDIVDYIANHLFSFSTLPVKMRCECGFDVLPFYGRNPGVKALFECQGCGVLLEWPTQQSGVLAKFHLESRCPPTYVTMLEWDHTTIPAHSHFVNKASGPDLEAEIKRRYVLDLKETRKLMAEG